MHRRMILKQLTPVWLDSAVLGLKLWGLVLPHFRPHLLPYSLQKAVIDACILSTSLRRINWEQVSSLNRLIRRLLVNLLGCRSWYGLMVRSIMISDS